MIMIEFGLGFIIGVFFGGILAIFISINKGE
jgi:hypothetical protein